MKTKIILGSIIISLMLMSSTCCYDDYDTSNVVLYYPNLQHLDTITFYKTEKGNVNNIIDSTFYYYEYSNSIYVPMFEYLNNDLIINVNNEYIDTISQITQYTKETNCGSYDRFNYYFNKHYTNATRIKIVQKDN